MALLVTVESPKDGDEENVGCSIGERYTAAASASDVWAELRAIDGRSGISQYC